MRGSEPRKPLIAIGVERAPDNPQPPDAAARWPELWSLERLKAIIDSRMNDYLCDMKLDHDDSIVGFNEAWDIVRAAFDEALGLKVVTKEIAPGIRETYLPSRTHEVDLPGVDFSVDDAMRYYTHLKFDSVAQIRRMYGTKGE